MSVSPEKPWPKFLCSYRYEGHQWNFHLSAKDLKDAEARLAAIHFNGQVDGELMFVIPVSPPDGLFIRMITFLRSLISSS